MTVVFGHLKISRRSGNPRDNQKARAMRRSIPAMLGSCGDFLCGAERRNRPAAARRIYETQPAAYGLREKQCRFLPNEPRVGFGRRLRNRTGR